jgi:hypothetical protein
MVSKSWRFELAVGRNKKDTIARVFTLFFQVPPFRGDYSHFIFFKGVHEGCAV